MSTFNELIGSIQLPKSERTNQRLANIRANDKYVHDLNGARYETEENGEIWIQAEVNYYVNKAEALATLKRLRLELAAKLETAYPDKRWLRSKVTAYGFWNIGQFCVNGYQVKVWAKKA